MCGLRPRLADSLQMGQAGLRAAERAAGVDPQHQIEALHRRGAVPVSEMALALFTRTSIPPKCSAQQVLNNPREVERAYKSKS